MAVPFTVTSVSNYNSNPPSDDGSQTSANRVQWSTQKTKLSDPIKTAFDSSETATSNAFGKIPGGAGFTSTGVNYTVATGDQGKTVKATASAITITTPDATVVGSPFVFSLLNNSSGDITLAGNGTQTVDGSLTVDIPVGCGCMLNTDGSNWFTMGQNWNGSTLQAPGGYLTLTSATPIITGDVSAAAAVYYTPYVNDKIPISTDGSTFKIRGFTELTLTLVVNHLASTLYDVFVFDNSGTTTVATGPAWGTNTAGSCARGTGAGTTELQRVHGFLTNKNSMTARNGSTTYTVAAGEGTYVGSIFIDGSAGQVSCHRTIGQSRKWGVWNAYNRTAIILQVTDSTASWAYGTNTIRSSDGNSANSLATFCGLAEEEVEIFFSQTIHPGAAGGGQNGIGLNVTNAFVTGSKIGTFTSSGSNLIADGSASYTLLPALGINNINCLENAPSGVGITFSGTTGMLMYAKWRG